MSLKLRHGARGAGTNQTPLPLTPLIDISLMLAVLLIAVMDADRDERQVPVQLPQAATGQSVEKGFEIVITADGSVMFNGQTISSEGLVTAAKGQSSAIIRADGAVAHRHVIAVVDTLRGAGVTRILYGTQSGLVEW